MAMSARAPTRSIAAAPPGHVPRRGRPNAARASAIDRTIIAVARNHFLADGFDAVSMEQVAAQARISKGTLYARHASKEALFKAVIDAMVAELSEEAGRNDDRLPQDIEGRLRYHAQTIAQAALRPDVQALNRLFISTSHRFPLLSAAMYNSGYRFIVDLLTNDIEAAARREGQTLRDPAGVARMLVNAITGLQVQELVTTDRAAELAQFADRVVDLIVAGRAAW